jgi:hypothetical protein
MSHQRHSRLVRGSRNWSVLVLASLCAARGCRGKVECFQRSAVPHYSRDGRAYIETRDSEGGTAFGRPE